MVGEVAGEGGSVEDGEEASVEAGLAGVIPMLGIGLGMACLMITLIGNTDLGIPTKVMAQGGPMAITRGENTRRFKMCGDQFLSKFGKEERR